MERGGGGRGQRYLEEEGGRDEVVALQLLGWKPSFKKKHTVATAQWVKLSSSRSYAMNLTVDLLDLHLKKREE